MRKPFWIAFAFVFIVPAATVAYKQWPRHDPRVLAESTIDFSDPYSNISPEDYVGPAACAQCHGHKFEQWSTHPHGKMNQLPTPASVRGDFSDEVLHLGSGSVRFAREGDRHVMTLDRGGAFLRRYEVTRTVGSRYMQFYIGRQTAGPEPAGHPLYSEHMLPFAYWITLGRWLPKPFFDPDGPERLRDGVPLVEGIDHIQDVRQYNQVCMNCHNTFAYSYRVFHPMFVGFPTATVSVALGPLSAALSAATPVRPLVDDFVKLNGRLDPDQHLLRLGISCESCHFGGREHAVNGKPIRFVPSSPFLKMTPKDEKRAPTDSRRNAATVNGICAQCHSGNTRMFPNGSAECNSREALDFTGGACASKLSCVKCHDPHVTGEPSGGPTRPEHVEVCVSCHRQYDGPEAALAHGRHAAATGVTCLDCHMPRQTLGLDALVRTHRITVPVHQTMVDKGSANACNQCHLDRPPRWTLTELERGWGRVLDPTAVENAGLLDQPLGEVWLASKEQQLRLIATQSYAQSPWAQAKLPDLVRSLNDAEPINRVFALKAVERVLGRKLGREEYELTAPPAERERQIESLRIKRNGRKE
jgi:hypothetical protein